MFYKKLRFLAAVMFCFGWALFACVGGSLAEEDTSNDIIDTKEQAEFYITIGELVSLRVHSLTRIAVGDPGIIEIVNADVDELLIMGRKAGDTSVFIWDEYGKKKITAHVLAEDVDLLSFRVQNLLREANIQNVSVSKNKDEGKIVLAGTIYKGQSELLKEVLKPFGKAVINLVQEQGDLIQIDAQISELSSSLTEILGFDWSTGAEGLRLGYLETEPTWDHTLGDWFRIGDFTRTTSILAVVSAAITEGKGRILSKPSLVVSSGEEAEILVGGEIPIRTTTTTESGALQENVNFVTYGVQMTVTPEIRDGKIDIKLSTDIKDVDASNAVGENVAFTTRKASTRVILNNEQTIVLAGLIKHSKGEQVKRIPFLSAIPVVGLLFREKSINPDQELELVISLTPRILKQQVMPADPMAMAASATTKGHKDSDVLESEATGSAFDIGDDNEESEGGMMEAPFYKPATDETLSSSTPEGGEADADLTGKASVKETQDPQAAKDLMSDEMVSKAVTGYVQAVQNKITSAISFPYEAQEKGWEGTVVLVVTLLSDGTMSDVEVKESSGYALFDQDAVNTAKILAPYEAFPAEVQLEEMRVTVPIVYSSKLLDDTL